MVLGVHNQTISVIVVIISVIAYFSVKNNLNCPKEYNDNENESNKILLIAITSSQENFEQRQSIRNTWAKLITNESLKYYFLVGEKFCLIPPRLRVSHLTCEEWKPKLNSNASEETVFSTSTKPKHFDSEGEGTDLYRSVPVVGFSFLLNHGITISHFGIKSSILTECRLHVKLLLIDLITKKKILSATFINNYSSNQEDFFWKSVQKTTLPSGFEGKIIIEGECNFQNIFKEDKKDGCNVPLSDITNVIKFLQVFMSKNISSIYTDNICTYVGFIFSIKNINEIHELIANKEREWVVWQKHASEKTIQLNNEIGTYKDILLLDVVDVYRNLPMKMLQFYKWYNQNHNKKRYEYLLKTDDDVFVDIPKIIKELEIKYDNKNEWNWWSCFRVNWPVQKAGKWRELFLNQTLYPAFPSGAGYILHSKVIKYINENIDNLIVNLQGEDVAIGLWLNDLKPKMHVSSYCRWSCDSNCWKDACNIMELNVTTMYEHWQRYLSCNNSFCWCK